MDSSDQLNLSMQRAINVEQELKMQEFNKGKLETTLKLANLKRS